jgi:ABC-type Zn uptake system ZnuABC Zn-binding protein ZnuA
MLDPHHAVKRAELESSPVKTPGFLKALTIGAAAALALTSCSAAGAAGNGTPDTSQAGRLSVVVTTTQLADFTAQIGGDDIELTSLLTPGASAHHFDPTPRDLLSLGHADVLVINGAGLDEFVDAAIEASGFAGTVIDASAGIDLATAREITAEGGEDQHAAEGHGHEGEEHAEEHGHAHDSHPSTGSGVGSEGSAGEAVHEAGDDHDHDHGDLNPHLWTSPRMAQGMVTEIAEGLAAKDRAHGDAYLERASAYNEQLGALDEWILAQYARVPAEARVLVTGHDSLRYYLHDYDIAFAGSLLPSFEDNAEPSAAEIDALVAAIKQRGVKAIFVESSLSPKLAQTVAREAGVTVVDAESLYADSLGPKGSGAETYISATAHNTRVILEAWGAAVDPLPSQLEGQ